MSKVLLFGPLTPPLTGQAVAFTIVANSLPEQKKILIDTSKYKNPIINTFYSVFKVLFSFAFYKFSNIYFTSSRSKLGFIKDFLLLIMGLWFKKKIINHLHGADFKKFYGESIFLKPLISYAYKGVNTSIVLLNIMKNQYDDFPKMKKVVVGNCYNQELEECKNDFSKNNYQILFLSNLMYGKGIIDFLDACFVLLGNNEEIKIKIAGKLMGDTFMRQKNIEKLFKEKYNQLRGVYGERVEYLGIVKGYEKSKVLFESSIFVLPSFYPTEAYPISIIEAMRAGNAIVTTNHNYLPYIVKEKNGVIISPKSPNEIYSSVEKLINNLGQLKKIQRHNIKEAKHKYSQDRYISDIQQIILS
ncbi:glycosyltransferase [Maribellus comscasis]|uniref:Glycosyltransferase n=1 Tax=Maribellus comscasis TaxID=2681766 RepID=A0A6I6K4Q3_9BACT|nr:glycosyltransferase family 4 protein [Maribellus comscasis]QGY46573.1 glycosyltransferase [Maribellus comscasis]